MLSLFYFFINEDNIMEYGDNVIKFHCPIDNELTDTNECIDCDKKLKCDIYSTMLDE